MLHRRVQVEMSLIVNSTRLSPSGVVRPAISPGFFASAPRVLMDSSAALAVVGAAEAEEGSAGSAASDADASGDAVTVWVTVTVGEDVPPSAAQPVRSAAPLPKRVSARREGASKRDMSPA